MKKQQYIIFAVDSAAELAFVCAPSSLPPSLPFCYSSLSAKKNISNQAKQYPTNPNQKREPNHTKPVPNNTKSRQTKRNKTKQGTTKQSKRQGRADTMLCVMDSNGAYSSETPPAADLLLVKARQVSINTDIYTRSLSSNSSTAIQL